MKEKFLKILMDFCTMAYDSGSSPEAVSSAIVAIITALGTMIVGIIAAFRAIDKKNGKECCRFTGKKFKKDNPEESKKD